MHASVVKISSCEHSPSGQAHPHLQLLRCSHQDLAHTHTALTDQTVQANTEHPVQCKAEHQPQHTATQSQQTPPPPGVPAAPAVQPSVEQTQPYPLVGGPTASAAAALPNAAVVAATAAAAAPVGCVAAAAAVEH